MASRVAASILAKTSRRVDKGWVPSLVFYDGPTPPRRKEAA